MKSNVKGKEKIIQKLVNFKCLVEYIKKDTNFVETLFFSPPPPHLFHTAEKWDAWMRVILSMFPVLFPCPSLVGQITRESNMSHLQNGAQRKDQSV